MPKKNKGNYCNGLRRANYKELKDCPRCQKMPLPLGHPGALSRYDNETEICSACGMVESFEIIP